MKFFLFIILIIAVAFGAVAFQNDTEVSVKFIKWDYTEHIAIVLGIPFVIGLVAGISLLLPSLWKKASNARHLKKQLHELEEARAKESEPVAEDAHHEGEAEQKPDEGHEVKEPEKEKF